MNAKLVKDLREDAIKCTAENFIHYAKLEDHLSERAANKIIELECHTTNLFYALRDMHHQHKCGCNYKGCNRCEDDATNELLLKRVWL